MCFYCVQDMRLLLKWIQRCRNKWAFFCLDRGHAMLSPYDGVVKTLVVAKVAFVMTQTSLHHSKLYAAQS